MRAKYTLLAFILFVACFPTLAQKSGTGAGNRSNISVSANKAKKVPDYQLYLKIADGPKLFVSIVTPSKNNEIEPLDLTSLITDLPGGADRFNSPNTSFPKVVVESSPNVSMLDFWNPLTLFRTERTDIKVRISSDFMINVRWADNNSVAVKPNPLILDVKVDDAGNLSLNNESEGTISEPMALTRRLQEIFRDREANGVFRSGTTEVEKSVNIIMPMGDRKFSDLITIAKAVRMSGSDALYLMMNDDPSSDVRKELIDVPAAPPKRVRPNR